ncbi:LIM and senescent cell antigen-like-containing domain protein 2 isoform X1 [Tenrec ecaudatus]|uniref:LIM and senescent cell antigen-like-containing domain protein 2 isoform X1 n=1 Tax=Tenrec ecaudatus TaxID=94439 RepID=UPI003F5AB706
MTGSNMSTALANAVCQRCRARFGPAERIVNSNGELFHENCFVCAQCFRQFPDGLFYEFEGRKYCEHDFQMLFAPCCGSCGEFIIGRVIKAMNNSWHPGCFRCELCDTELADLGFVKNADSWTSGFPSERSVARLPAEELTGWHDDSFLVEIQVFLQACPGLCPGGVSELRPWNLERDPMGYRHLCRPCHNQEKAKRLGKYVCQRCYLVIDEQPLMFRNDAYHADHFNCTHCGKELTAEARELKGELYCLPCHDKMGVPICGACRRPIEGRVVNALGKQWHVEHFVCAKCEKPFLGHRHYEKKGLAYCETHYNQLFGDVCYNCSHVIEGDVVSALNKAWCVNCFSCSTCSSKLTLKNKFVEFDMKPVCRKCYEKFPLELKRRLKKLSTLATRRAHPKAVDFNSA